MSTRVGLIFICVLLSGSVFSQDLFWKKENKRKFELPKISITRSGPYIGLQRGKFNVLEFGLEGQYKRIKLIKPVTHAMHMGFNYNFFKNVLGYDVGYWLKMGRVNLTYGVNFAYRTDFNQSRIGITPVVGYKFWQLHLQTGVHLLSRSNPTFPTNILFISLRFVIVNQRDIDFKK
jgi:hypothetical protein